MRHTGVLRLTFIFCCHSLSLAAFEYQCEASYPGGFRTQWEGETDLLLSSVEFTYDNEDLKLSQFSFVSPFLSLGALVPSGLMKTLDGSESLIDYEIESGMSVDRDGSIESNQGILFSLAEESGGIAARRKETYSHTAFWFEPQGFKVSRLFLAQSFSFNESSSESDEWYIQEEPLFSRIISHTLISLLLMEGDYSGGGVFLLNLSEADRGGYAVVLTVKAEKNKWQFQNDLTWSSSGLVFADFESPDYTLENRMAAELIVEPFEVKGTFLFACGEEHTLWELAVEGQFDREGMMLESGAEFSVLNHIHNPLEPMVSLWADYKRSYTRIFWTLGADAKYEDEIYAYVFLGGCGLIADPFLAEISSSLEVDKSIMLNCSSSVAFQKETYEIQAGFSLEDIGLYNSGEKVIKPSVSLQLTINND